MELILDFRLVDIRRTPRHFNPSFSRRKGIRAFLTFPSLSRAVTGDVPSRVPAGISELMFAETTRRVRGDIQR